MVRAKQQGQSVVEFGIIAVLFTLIMFAIADFGLLLNDWLSVSSAARLLARDAALGTFTCSPTQCPGTVQPGLWNEASVQAIPGVTYDPHFVPNGYCCAWGNPGSAVQVMVSYFDNCTPQPGTGTCNEVNTNQLDSRYSTHGSPGTCTSWQPPLNQPCPHPAPPGNACAATPNCPGDSVVLTLRAAGAQVITPLVRPFFNNPGTCPDNSTPSRCYVALSSTVTMRFEGDTL